MEALAAAFAPAVPAAEVKLSPRAPVKGGFVWGTGRRKSSVARVRIKDGTGVIEVNSRKMEAFFPTEQAQRIVTKPLRATETLEKYDIFANVNGGGITGQAGAVSLGIGRALKGIEPSLEAALREGGFLTRDSRMKERKKYGLRGARRAFQFSKR
ncbi:MAG: 30S ribosomal protein S9, partial [Planctomycetota bacterium]